MSAESILQFNHYVVDRLNYKMLDYRSDHATIKPKLSVSISDESDNNYRINLNYLLKSTDEEPLPFDIDVSITGFFTINSDDEKLRDTLINENAVAILFPFLRSTIASLTTLANKPPLILPIVNVSALHKASLAKTESEKDSSSESGEEKR